MKQRTTEDTMKPVGKLPKLSEINQVKRGRVKDLGFKTKVIVEWGMNEKSRLHQVFKLTTEQNGVEHEAYISRQELEHYLRAV